MKIQYDKELLVNDVEPGAPAECASPTSRVSPVIS